nr:alpha-ribazole phosphatase [Streptoalloteichus tenebrarius]
MLVRHGETTWHAENRYAGRSEVPLTPHGKEQAERLADWARTAGLAALWCSPQGRARDTAAPVAHATGLEPVVDERLCELGFGRAEGMTTAEMEREFPERLAAFRADPVAHHMPEGEDPRVAVDRGTACLLDITERVPEGRVLVVAHGTLLRLVICHLLGIPVSAYRRVFPVVRNTGITELRIRDDVTSLLQFNTPIEALSV